MIIQDTNAFNMKPWPTGMPSGWWDTSDGTQAMADQMLANWNEIPSAVSGPMMNSGSIVYQGDTYSYTYPRLFMFTNVSGGTGDKLLHDQYLDYANMPHGVSGLNSAIGSIFISTQFKAYAAGDEGALAHEFGHLVDATWQIRHGNTPGRLTWLSDIHDFGFDCLNRIPASLYAHTNDLEWWAELFDAYVRRDHKKFASCIVGRADEGVPIDFTDANIATGFALMNSYLPFPGNTQYQAYTAAQLLPIGSGIALQVGDLYQAYVTLDGNPAPSVSTIKWQKSIDNGVTYTTIATGVQYLSDTPAINTNVIYRCLASNSIATDTVIYLHSFTVMSSGRSDNTIYLNPPKLFNTAAGVSVTIPSFSSLSTVTGVWQENISGTWTDLSDGGLISGSTTGLLTIFTTSPGTRQFRRHYSYSGFNSYSTTTSIVTTGTAAAPVITGNPSSTSGYEGEGVFFTSSATGTPTPTKQWQRSNDGGNTWTNISAANLSSFGYTVSSYITDNGAQFRCVYTNTLGSATTSSATLTTFATTVYSTGFEAGTTDSWTAVPGTQISTGPSASTTLPRTGTYDLAVVRTVTGSKSDPASVRRTLTGLTIGTLYQLTGWIRVGSGVSIRPIVTGLTTGAWIDPAPSTYTKFTLNFTASATSHDIGVDWTDNGSDPGAYGIRLDDVLVIS